MAGAFLCFATLQRGSADRQRLTSEGMGHEEMPSSDRADLKQALGHVLWIGGAPDAGKTSVARFLSRNYRLRWYNFDYFEPEHVGRLNPERHPALHAFIGMTMDQRWVLRPVEVMAQVTIGAWTERFGMVVEDLLSWPRDGIILAEGPGFFPECVAPLISSPRQAVWLVPTEAFKRATHSTRENKVTMPLQTSDPERAYRNHVERDLRLARHVQERVEQLGLTVHEVDGTRSIEEMTALVEAHFAPLLPGVDEPGAGGA